MASVLGRLEERERAARKRVEELQAELEAAQSEWDEWLIARRRVGEVCSGAESAGPSGQAEKTPARNGAVVSPAARPGSVVPIWRTGLSIEVLAAEYQQVMGLLAERRAIGAAPLNCREATALLGLETVPAKIEGVRVKLKRLVARGWAQEPAPGRFACPDGPDGGS
ncbi:hypothetical protein GCM10010358_81280 [Streptomyces minutiscleroticus]|uniref:Uncharacterized protein n=1 Tax=Streptomyces minutiscleroticus TaxID=68238 RepID=A0A918P3X8_9ACTN|nr:hypothetical protein [Streptomyces minutiscleroticus]GGY17603.1 hypothetical protein GCM10010358_81280 [Streptomyces minutiscleroticus]